MANLLKQHEFWLGMFIIALCLMLGWRSEEFFTFGNIYDLANNYAMLTILACGLFVVLIAGGIDISFPAGDQHHEQPTGEDSQHRVVISEVVNITAFVTRRPQNSCRH